MVDFETRTAQLDDLLGVGRNFDMVSRSLQVGGRKARLWVVNGYAEDMLIERMIGRLLAIGDLKKVPDLASFLAAYVTVPDAAAETDVHSMVVGVFEEPDTSKVLRGSHDGFVESIMANAALLRRRIRDPALTLERHQVGGRSQTDVALVYMKGEANEQHLRQLRQKLDSIDVRSITMSQESIAECIVPKQWWNPFPKIRYTERPDVATASVMEGSILLMIDNTPSVMLLPTTLFSFAEEINDYYFPPLIGTYLRIVRLVVLFLTVFITPLWYLLVKNGDVLPGELEFLLIEDEYFVPLIVQLLLVEFIVDILKLASLNTPDALSNSFSMLGALILGDFAVQARWLVPEVLVYMAFVAVAGYAQHSYEMGYACKLVRMILLVLIWLWDGWGFAAGVVGTVVLIASTKPVVGKGYLYPLIPFNGKRLMRILRRRPIDKDNT